MSEADSVREMWDSSRQENKRVSILRVENRIGELKAHPDMEDYHMICGYLTALFETNILDLQEVCKLKNEARSAMSTVTR